MNDVVGGMAKVARGPDQAIWWPVTDGRVLPRGPRWPEAPAVSAQVPLMIGTTATEMTMRIGPLDAATFALDEDGLRERVLACQPGGRSVSRRSALSNAIGAILRHRHGEFVSKGRLDAGRSEICAERGAGIPLRTRRADAN